MSLINDYPEENDAINNNNNNNQGLQIELQTLNDDIILNIFEFLERSFVLHSLSLCSQQFYELAHKPYNYTRLVWKFSNNYYEKLNHIKSYYSALKYIEVSDSDRFGEATIDESRLEELSLFIAEHQETLKGVEMIFNKNQENLFDKIATICGSWLSELSINVLLDTDFAKKVCSKLHHFHQLKVLKLLVGKSIDPYEIFDSEKARNKIQLLETFETTLYLFSQGHVESFCSCVRSVRNISFSINCEVFETNDSLLNSLLSCLEGKERISIHFFNVPSISFLNRFKEVSTNCREMHISIVDMKNPAKDEPLTLSKVYSFTVSHASFIPTVNAFPVDAKIISFAPSLKFGAVFTLDDTFGSRCTYLTRLELCNTSLDRHCLPNLEFVNLTSCCVHSVESIIEISPKLQIVRLVDCQTTHPTLSIPKREHLRELVLKETKRHSNNIGLVKFQLRALQELQLNILHLDRFVYEKDELHHLEDMISLEYLYIYSDTLDILNQFKWEKLTNLKQLFLDAPPNNTVTTFLTNILENPTVYRQAIIALPVGPWFKKPNLTDEQVDSIILSVIVDKIHIQLIYTLNNDNFTYMYLMVDNKPAFILFNNETYKIENWKIFKDTAIHHSILSRSYYRHTRHTRPIYAPSPKSSSKCSLM